MQSLERRIDDIECLRALAVLGVVVHHAHGNLIVAPSRGFDAFTQIFGLWVGVDLFFAISGFVIGRSFLPRMQTAVAAGNGCRTTFAFWVRRFFRLTPSAWLWLWLTLLAAIYFNRSGVFGGIHANAMATLAGMFDYANYRFADAFTHYPYGASFQYWSLSLEEQFYLLLPLCTMIFRRWLPWPLLGLIVFLALLPMRTVLAMALRTDAIAWGVLLSLAWGGAAWRRCEPVWLEKPWLRWPVLFGLLAAITRLGGVDVDSLGQWKIAAIALLACALVWIASYNRNYLFRPALLRKPLIWIGARSYAIYLIHIFAFFLVREIASRLQGANMPHVPGGYTFFAIVLIALLADANYRWVEQPLRRLGAKFAAQMESK